MATFLALEELCNEQSLTPRQTEAVFKVSKSLMKKQMQAEESTKGTFIIILCVKRITYIFLGIKKR